MLIRNKLLLEPERLDRATAARELVDESIDMDSDFELIMRKTVFNEKNNQGSTEHVVRLAPVAVDDWHPEGLPMAAWLEQIVLLERPDSTVIDCSVVTMIAMGLENMPRQNHG